MQVHRPVMSQAHHRTQQVGVMTSATTLRFDAPALHAALAQDAGRLRPAFVRKLADAIGSRRLALYEARSFAEGPWLRVGRAPGAATRARLRAALIRSPKDSDSPDDDTALILPIRARDRCLGVLWVAWPGTTKSPRPAMIAALHDWVAVALTMAMQYRAASLRAAMLDMIQDLSNLLGADEEVDTTLQRLISYLHRRFKLTLATLSLVVHGGTEVILKAHAGHSRVPLERDQVWPAERGVTGRAIRSGEMQFVPDVSADPDYVEGNARTRAELILPVRLRDQVIGLINLESASERTFSRSARQALQALADQVAAAIHLATTRARLEQVNGATTVVLHELNSSNRRLALANSRLEELSLRDTLTGIGNRRNFDRALNALWRESRGSGMPLALLLLDVDHFKKYNDHFGHPAGDQCLRQVAQAIRSTLRGKDLLVSRYGGEEFAVLVAGADESAARRVAQRLQRAIERLRIAHAPRAGTGCVTVSVGVACAVAVRGVAPVWLVHRADAALYEAKSRGRNRVHVA